MILASGLQVVLESQNGMIIFYDSIQSVYAFGSPSSTLYYFHSHVFCRYGSCYVFINKSTNNFIWISIDLWCILHPKQTVGMS